MTAVHDRTPHRESQFSTERRHRRSSEPSVLMAAAGATALCAVAIGVVAAYLVFPEPTMWRVTVNCLVIALAVHPIRGLLRRAWAQDGHRLVADAEADL